MRVSQETRVALDHIKSSLRFVFALSVLAIVIVGLFSGPGMRYTSEAKFTDTSPGGLSIVPASCPSFPHYSGECTSPCIPGKSPADVHYGSNCACTNGLDVARYPSCTCPSGTIQSGSTCIAPSASTCMLTAAPSSISSGQSSTLSWTTTNAGSSQTRTISPIVGSVAVSGSSSVSPTTSTTYDLAVTTSYSSGSSQTIHCFATVTIGACVPNGTLSCSGNNVINSCNAVVQDCTASGRICSGGACVCPSGFSWNGSACVAGCVPSGTYTCADSTHRSDSCGTISACPSGQTCSNGICSPASCTPSYFCSGSNLYHQDSSCHNTLVEACSYGCSNGACNTGPTPLLTFTVAPLLVHSGDPTHLSWTTQNITSCTVNGSNGNSWTGITGSYPSSGIQGQTIFTIQCLATDNSTITQSKTVNIIPNFCEPGAPGC